MKKLFFFVPLALLAACQTGGANLDVFGNSTLNSGDVVVKVGDVEIREGFLENLGKTIPSMKEKIDNPMTRKKLLNSIVEQELLFQEAKRRGLDKTEAVLLKSLLNQRSVLASSVLEDELQNAMQKAYNEKKATEFTRVAISQIAIDFLTKAQKKEKVEVTKELKEKALRKAQDIVARINKGEDFGKLAKELSDDSRTAKRDGAAGKIKKKDKRYERLGLKPVIEKAFSMKKDQVSGPIEVKSGYYIIKVTSDVEETPFEEAKRVLGFELQQKIKGDMLTKLKKDTKVTYGSGEKAEAPGHTKDDGHGHGK